MKKITVRLCLVLSLLFSMVFVLPLEVSAQNFYFSNGVEAEIKTDKDEYTADEDIKVLINMKNTDIEKREGILVKMMLPQGLVAKSGNLAEEGIGIDSGSTYTFSVVIELLDELKTGNTITNEDLETGSNQEKIGALAGDHDNVLLWLVLLVVSIIVFLFALKSKKTPKVLSIILWATILSTILTVNVVASEKNINSITIDKTIIIDGKEYSLQALIEIPVIIGENEGIVDQTDNTDTDNDKVPDWVENEFDTNTEANDTDGDGLSDYEEIFLLSSSPIKEDTDGNGVLDADEDFDNDGISNIDEIKNGINPVSSDTDGDDVIDKDEYQYGTDPLKEDTDSDGAFDGWEIENSFDPLIYNDSFLISSEKMDENIVVSVTLETSGEAAADLEITKIEDSIFFNSSIPGYISPAYDFSLGENGFDTATISFEFEEALLENENFNPVIYYYNEETQMMEELETMVSGTTASTVVSHFSTYILLNKVDFDKIWEEEIRVPSDNTDSDNNSLDMVLLIDCSGSMGPQGANNDPNNIRLDVSKKLVEKVGENDRVAVICFGEEVTLLTDFTSDKGIIYEAIDSVGNTDSETNINQALNTGFSVYDNSYEEDVVRYMILLTDGKSSDMVLDYTEKAIERNIVIFTVGLGTNLDESLLTSIATSTGGKYYHATEADDLYSIYDEIEDETIDFITDSNGDGISDYYTQLICDGVLRSGTGVELFEGISFDNIQLNDDYDNDGKKNGEEVIISSYNGKVFIEVISSPILGDSDNDGLMDQDDTAPLKKGIANDVIGNLALISCYNSEDAAWTSGHAFFVYTSYINDSIDFTGLVPGWSRIDRTLSWAWTNLQEDSIASSEYIVSCNESVAIGNGANGGGWFGSSGNPSGSGDSSGSGSSAVPTSEHNGVNYNMEVYKHFSSLGYTYLDNTYITRDITEAELRELIEYCSQDSVNYWSLTHNCATVACDAYNNVFDCDVNPYNSDFLFGTVATPKGLKNNLREEHSASENFDFVGSFN